MLTRKHSTRTACQPRTLRRAANCVYGLQHQTAGKALHPKDNPQPATPERAPLARHRQLGNQAMSVGGLQQRPPCQCIRPACLRGMRAPTRILHKAAVAAQQRHGGRVHAQQRAHRGQDQACARAARPLARPASSWCGGTLSGRQPMQSAFLQSLNLHALHGNCTMCDPREHTCAVPSSTVAHIAYYHTTLLTLDTILTPRSKLLPEAVCTNFSVHGQVVVAIGNLVAGARRRLRRIKRLGLANAGRRGARQPRRRHPLRVAVRAVGAVVAAKVVLPYAVGVGAVVAADVLPAALTSRCPSSLRTTSACLRAGRGPCAARHLHPAHPQCRQGGRQTRTWIDKLPVAHLATAYVPPDTCPHPSLLQAS